MTLQDQIWGAISHAEEMNSRHRLSPTETHVLADHAIEMQKLHFPLIPQDIRIELSIFGTQKTSWPKLKVRQLGLTGITRYS